MNSYEGGADNLHRGRVGFAMGRDRCFETGGRRYSSVLAVEGEYASFRRPGSGQPGAPESRTSASSAALRGYAGIPPRLPGIPRRPGSRNDGAGNLRPARLQRIQSSFSERIEADCESGLPEAAGKRERSKPTRGQRADTI